MKTTSSLLLLFLAQSTVACATGRLRIEPFPPRHAVAKTGLKVALLPFGDDRDHEKEERTWWYAVPLVPYSTSVDDRADERHTDPDGPLHLRRQLPELLAQQLADAKLFGEVRYIDAEWVDPAAWDLVITGDLKRSTHEESRTLYGLSVAGLPLWLLGAPLGKHSVAWEMTVSLRDPGSKESLKELELESSWSSWAGLFWGASGYPEDEGQALHDLVGKLLAEVDRALDEVPALAALTARPVLAEAPQPTTVNKEVPALGKMFVLGDDANPVQQRLVDLFAEELTRQSTGTVMGLADVDLLIGMEKRRALLGCNDPACYSDIGAALEADLLFHLTFGQLGGQQTMTIKVLEPHNAKVVSRRTWQAAGRDPAFFSTRLPDIVSAAIASLNAPPKPAPQP